MVSVYEVRPNELIEEAAKELSNMPEYAPPEWAVYCKTGVSKERPPVRPDWWYVRAASVLRAVYKFGPIGVSKLRTKYGGRKNRGVVADKTFKGGGNIIRTILQQHEEAGYVAKAEQGVHKGRILTPKGKAFMDSISLKVQAAPKPEQKEKAAPKVEKAPAKAPKKKAEKVDDNGAI